MFVFGYMVSVLKKLLEVMLKKWTKFNSFAPNSNEKKNNFLAK